jgi:hypothetical protein
MGGMRRNSTLRELASSKGGATMGSKLRTVKRKTDPVQSCGHSKRSGVGTQQHHSIERRRWQTMQRAERLLRLKLFIAERHAISAATSGNVALLESARAEIAQLDASIAALPQRADGTA